MSWGLPAWFLPWLCNLDEHLNGDKWQRYECQLYARDPLPNWCLLYDPNRIWWSLWSHKLITQAWPLQMSRSPLFLIYPHSGGEAPGITRKSKEMFKKNTWKNTISPPFMCLLVRSGERPGNTAKIFFFTVKSFSFSRSPKGASKPQGSHFGATATLDTGKHAIGLSITFRCTIFIQI